MKKVILGILCVLVLMCNISYGDVLVDQFNYMERAPNNIVATLSDYGEVELVSFFELKAPVMITHVEWSGLLREFDEEGEHFNVRIYRTNINRPTKLPRRDFDIIAYGEKPYPWARSVVFFTSEDLDGLFLTAGRYWISFSYIGPHDFYMAIEDGKENVTTGSGGAGRYPNGPWLSGDVGETMLNARGMSIAIHGESLW